jgi:hypothetical protein
MNMNIFMFMIVNKNPKKSHYLLRRNRIKGCKYYSYER